MSGGGGSKTQIVQPTYPAEMRSFINTASDRANTLFTTTKPKTYTGPVVSPITNYEKMALNKGYGAASQISGLAKQATGLSNKIIGLGSQGLDDIGGWQGAISQASSGKVNPQINRMVDAAQNALMRQYDRVKSGYEHSYESMAGQAQQAFDTASLSATQQHEQAAKLSANQFDNAILGATQDYERMANLATNQTEDARMAAMNDYERARLGAISGYERAAVPVQNQLEQYFSDQDQSFYEQMLPSIRGQASMVGGYGGSRHAISDAVAARDVQEAKLQQLGRVGEAFGLGAGQLGEALALNAGQLGEMNLQNANRLSDQLGLGAAQLGAGIGQGSQQLAQYLGIGEANLAQQLGLGASQLGNTLALGAQQTGENIYQAGSQAAEQAGDIGATMYGTAFENAQNRALEAAGLGMQGSIAQRELQQNALTSGLSGLGAAANMAAMPTQIYAGLGQLQSDITDRNIQNNMYKLNADYNNNWQHLNNYTNAMAPLMGGAMNPQVIPGGGSSLGAGIGAGIAGAGTGFMMGAAPGSIGGPLGAALGGGLGLMGGMLL